ARVDILVHSAGVIRLGSVAEAVAEDFDLQYRTNCLGPYLLTQKLLPALRSQQGQVVFVNSSAGQVARAKVGQYAATKHALRALADSLRGRSTETASGSSACSRGGPRRHFRSACTPPRDGLTDPSDYSNRKTSQR